MDHMKVLSRAWTITWRNRALWLFGCLFVLAGGAGGGGGGGGNPDYHFGGGDIPRQFGGGGPALPTLELGTVLIIALIVVAVIILLGVIVAIVRYVAETALMAGVDEIENTEAKLTVRRGFRLGWSRSALRLFLVDLVIGVPLTMLFIVLFALAATPLLLWLAKDIPDAIHIIATVISVGLILLVVLLAIASALILSLVMPYIRRRVVLGQQGVLASIRQGVKLVWNSLLDTGLMWLLLAGIGIVWGLAMIPVFIVLALLAILIGGVPAALVYLVSRSVVAAAIVGAPLFLLMFVPAVTFIQGLFEVYKSSAWTLAYREVASKSAALLTAPAASV